MILAIDMGNSNIVVGGIDDKRTYFEERITTDDRKTSLEYAIMLKNILEIHHLSKDYGTFRLEDVSFSLPRGVIMGLIGENGAGKSTTINCISGEVQKSGGKITLFGQAQAASEKENKDRIGVVFDENHFPDLFTPKELGQVMAGVYSHWDWTAYHAFLARFSLREDQKIKDFSKGMKVKLAFAVALSHGAEGFYDGWMKNKRSAMLSCNDGFRPVTFLVEALEEEV